MIAVRCLSNFLLICVCVCGNTLVAEWSMSYDTIDSRTFERLIAWWPYRLQLQMHLERAIHRPILWTPWRKSDWVSVKTLAINWNSCFQFDSNSTWLIDARFQSKWWKCLCRISHYFENIWISLCREFSFNFKR